MRTTSICWHRRTTGGGKGEVPPCASQGGKFLPEDLVNINLYMISCINWIEKVEKDAQRGQKSCPGGGEFLRASRAQDSIFLPPLDNFSCSPLSIYYQLPLFIISFIFSKHSRGSEYSSSFPIQQKSITQNMKMGSNSSYTYILPAPLFIISYICSKHSRGS